MSIREQIVADSSMGRGLIVVLHGSHTPEEFTNGASYFYLARETQLGDTYRPHEYKTVGLGDLAISRCRVGDQAENFVALFPKGIWKYVRIAENAIELDAINGNSERNQDFVEHSRDRCPWGCFVRGWKDLGEATKKAHNDYLHGPNKIKGKNPFK